eukprot:GDKJ01026678.1.p1 GENE.GDKJ01026678.1~~GDKJ01026678.1.p1  ORF type:complete len:236 (+),score=35.83 GDKJ01026678.1:19-726(+)
MSAQIVKIKGFGTAPRGRRPIGFRGGHDHGRPLNDPVYPTSLIPRVFVPRYAADWRNMGRRLLTMGLARLENKWLGTYKQSLDWQVSGPCAKFCAGACGKSPWRCMCTMRVVDTPTEHLVNMDGILREFKGEVIHKKPFWNARRKVIQKNRFHSEAMVWDPQTNTFTCLNRENINPAFGLLPNRRDDHYKGDDLGWDSESDAEFSDDENYCSDEEREMKPSTPVAVSSRKMVGKK